MHLSVENEDHQSFSGFSGDAALTFLNLSWSFFSCCSNAFNFSSASFFVIFEGCDFGKSFLSFSCCFCLSFFFGSSFCFFTMHCPDCIVLSGLPDFFSTPFDNFPVRPHIAVYCKHHFLFL